MTDDGSGDTSGRRAARWTRAEAVKHLWHQGTPPDALAILRADPDLCADKQIVLDLAYEEYCIQESAGHALPVEEFAAQFPTHRQSLLRLLAVHSFLNAHPAALKLPDVDWPLPGEALAEFAIVRQLGRGGFAHVYLARETTVANRAVVLKVSADGLEEANTLGPLAHPHIMRVLAARRIGDLSVLVMPFLGAATLEDIGSSKPTDSDQLMAACAAAIEPSDPAVLETLPSPFHKTVRFDLAIATLGSAVADALAFLHAVNLAHQDLKPSNVLLTPTGFPFLLDFNLTTHTSQSHSSVGGTVPYMAPEQLVAFCSPGISPTYDRAAADVYSLGVILYELLAGRHPFPGAGPSRNQAIPSRETVEARQLAPAPLASLNTSVSAAIATIVMACLSADPKFRPTARDVATRLHDVVEPRPRTRRLAWIAGISLGTLMAAAIGFSLFQADPPAAPDTPFERGVRLLNEGQVALAGSEFLTAAKSDADGRAYAFAAFCFSDLGLFDEAIFWADKAIELGFNEASVFNNRAYCHWQRNQFAEAERDCDRAIDLQFDCVESRFTRARVSLAKYLLDKQPLPDQAIKDITHVRLNGPPVFDVSLVAAQLYVARGDPLALTEAVAAVREAISRGGDPIRIKRTGRLVEALKNRADFQDALASPAGTPPAAKAPGLIRPR